MAIKYLDAKRIRGSRTAGYPSGMGSAADGTISGATHSTSSPPVGSGWLSFDGTNDYCTANGAITAMSTIGTIAVWFKFDVVAASENDSRIFEFGDTNNANWFSVALDYSGRLEMTNRSNYSTSGTTAWGGSTDVGSISAATWYHLVITHNGTTPTFWLGALGEDITDQTNLISGDPDEAIWIFPTYIDNFNIGRQDHSSTTSQYLDGGIAELAMWNVVLTDTQISDLHNASGSGVEASTISSGLSVHFNFNTSGDATNTAIATNEKVAITNVPENTVFEETDTRQYFFRAGSEWLTSGANYGYAQGGGSSPHNIIDRFPFATDTNATSVGTLTTGNYEQSSASDPVGGYSYLAGGKTGSTRYAYVQRHQNASSANSVQVGSANGSATRLSAGWHSLTHGYRAGGWSGSTNNAIKKYSFGTSANESDIADLTVARHRTGQCSSATHGYATGGHNN